MDLKVKNTHLNWSKPPPRVLVTADTQSFDQAILRDLRAEGFQTTYFPYNGDRENFGNTIHQVGGPLGVGEYWAVVAYGRAATATLDTCMKPVSKLAALVAYYPTQLPNTSTNLPPNLKSVVHIAGDQSLKTPPYPNYRYPNARKGFAEPSEDSYNKVAAGLSWSRTIAVLRKGLGLETNLEGVWEEHLALEFLKPDAENLMNTMVDEPYVNHIPTMTGGVGHDDLLRFYRDYFIPGNPPSLGMKLISRTIGSDRIVDEMILSFRHTQEVPYLLPGVKPTDKEVEIALVAIVCIRGNKLCHEHIYWDQASLLVQIGLLNPKGLPVRGAAAAKKVADASSAPSNQLIKGW